MFNAAIDWAQEFRQGTAAKSESMRVAAGIAELVLERGRRSPQHPALVIPTHGEDRLVTFGEFAERIRGHVAGLHREGHLAGERVMLLARPDEEIYAFALAVLAAGMTLVVADGRSDMRRLFAALRMAKPDVVVAPPALLQSWPFVGALRQARRISSGARMFGAVRLNTLGRSSYSATPIAQEIGDVPAIVSFTSGSTGTPKAVIRTQQVLLAQHRALAAAFPIEDGVNLPGFPTATLHNLACGVTTLLAPADLRSMADAGAAHVLACIEKYKVTSLSGAPTFLRNLASHIAASGAPVESIRRFVVGGGPVGRTLCTELRAAFPNAVGHVVYGATEAEPIAATTIDEVAATEGHGFLVGRPVKGSDVRIIASDRSDMGVGEVTVSGPNVAGGNHFHRTGDVARIDADGRIWLLGRVGEAVGELSPLWPYIPEAVAASIGGVRSSALVGHRDAPNGELVLQLDASSDLQRIVSNVRAAVAREIHREIPVRVVNAIPMDARHASKVLRAPLVRQLERAG
jgi:acyl-coenzyme A synthetase/AMP-(fatty) acid ligase